MNPADLGHGVANRGIDPMSQGDVGQPATLATSRHAEVHDVVDQIHEVDSAAVARHHGRLARATLVVRGPGLPGGAAVYTDDDLREAVAAIGRKAGIRFGDGEREWDLRRRELLRRAAVVAADREEVAGGDAVRVSADDLDAALDDLLDTRNRMTRRALGLESEPSDPS